LTVAYQTYEIPCQYNVLAADFNGDGNLDLACPHGEDGAGATYPNSYVTILLGDGHGSFSKSGANVTVGPGGTSIAVADFNGDGKADLAVSFYFSTANSGPSVPITTVTVALGNGDGTFAPATFISPYMNSEDGIAAGDFNGDGFPDFAITYLEGGDIGGALGPVPNLVSVFLGNGDGTFSENDVPVPHAHSSAAIIAADFNRDGRSDIAIAEGSIGVLLSQPTSATATVTGISPVGTGIHLVDANYPGIPAILSPSLSNTVGLEAEPVATTVTLFAAPITGVAQQPFRLAVTITPGSAQNHIPTGTVTFLNGATNLGTSQVTNGLAELTDSGLPVGTYTLTANYSGDTNFAAGTASLQYVVAATGSAITFTVANHTYGDPPFAVGATSPSPGAFTYSVISGPVSLSGSTVTITGGGLVVLQASQAASGLYPAGIQNAIFLIAPEAQTITFPAPSSPVIPSSPPVALSATASSGLPVTFSVVSGPATISGSTVTFTGLGAVVVAANQYGNSDYAVATQVTHTIIVGKATPAVGLTASPSPVFLLGPVTLTATVSSPAAVPTGTVVFTSGSTALGTATLGAGVASITVSTLPLGANFITATYSGDGNFNLAASTAASVTVQDFSLAVTGSPSATVQYGGIASYALAVTPIDRPTLPGAIGFTVAGAPAGSTFLFSPATLTAGSGASSVGLTIQVPEFIGAARDPGRGAGRLAVLALLGLVLPFRRKLKVAGWIGCIVLLLAGIAGSATLTGCGGDVTHPLVQTFNVTVTASSGALSHSASASLTVQ
jgi:hypothetical protein